MAVRVLRARINETIADYARRVWDNSGEDNIFFLAGGIAFNLLLAIVPFFLLLASGLAYFLKQSPDVTAGEVHALADRLLPPQSVAVNAGLHQILDEILKTHGAVTLYSAIGFVWFSTRLFGTLRTVLADVFDVEYDRGIVKGKIFDVQITIVATLLLVAYSALSAYLAIATTRGVQVLEDLGLRKDVMGTVEYSIGRLLALLFIVLTFFALYKILPNRRIRWQTALLASVVASGLFEIARNLFTTFVKNLNAGSLYTGTFYALVIVVSWVYYAALLFILGGEVAQVYELRRVRRLQRETFEA